MPAKTLKNLRKPQKCRLKCSWRPKLNALNLMNIFRALTFALAVGGLSFYVKEIYIKWIFNPDIMTTEKLISSLEIPMPAVTICSPLLGRIDKGNFATLVDLREDYPNFSEKLATEKCSQHMIQKCPWIAQSLLAEKAKRILMNVSDLDQCSPGINDTFFSCVFNRHSINCEKILNRVISEDGFCYSVNMLGIHEIFNRETISKDFESYRRSKITKSWSAASKASKIIFDDETDIGTWTLDGGYKKDRNVPVAAAKLNTLDFTMMINHDDFPNLCDEKTKSFKIIFHLPNEMPTPMHMINYVNFGTSKVFHINAEKFSTDESLRGYPPKVRGCYFDGERKLKFFASYTKTQCQYECYANSTLKMCKCVKYSMPKDNETKVCGLDKLYCMEVNELTWPPGGRSMCDCLPTCTDIKYGIEFERTNDFEIRERKKFLSHNFTFSSVVIKFPKNQIIKKERFTAYKLQDFIADCGGLVGFFLGISVLSIVRFARRIVKSIKRRKPQKSSVSLSEIKLASRQPKNIFVVSHH